VLAQDGGDAMNDVSFSLINIPKDTGQWVAVIIALAITVPQGIWLFRDAQKRGKFPWLWGLWGVLSAPLPIVFYYIFVIRNDRKRKGLSKKTKNEK
jgi:hypothetical protein